MRWHEYACANDSQCRTNITTQHRDIQVLGLGQVQAVRVPTGARPIAVRHAGRIVVAVSCCRKLSNKCLQVAELLQHINLRQYQATWAVVQPLNITNTLCCVHAGSVKQEKRLSDIRCDA